MDLVKALQLSGKKGVGAGKSNAARDDQAAEDALLPPFLNTEGNFGSRRNPKARLAPSHGARGGLSGERHSGCGLPLQLSRAAMDGGPNGKPRSGAASLGESIRPKRP
jgi:hypothetical protein